LGETEVEVARDGEGLTNGEGSCRPTMQALLIMMRKTRTRVMARLLTQVSAFRPGEQSCWWWVF